MIATFFASLALAVTQETPASPPPVAPHASESVRPKFAFLRANEDWSGYDPGPDARVLDAFKHIDLTGDGTVWLSFGGRAEARFETWNDFAFGAPSGADDEFLLSRAFLHGSMNIGESFRLFVEGKTAQATDRDLPGGRRALDLDTVDLQQAFVDVSFPFAGGRLTVRPGRQMFSFGAQRLLSPLPWGNTLRTWDGVTARWQRGPWSVSALATAFAPVDKTEFNDVDETNTLAGVYATRGPVDGGRGLDLYAIVNNRDGVTVNGTAGDEQRTTIGFRSWGPTIERCDFEVEAAYQTGSVGDGDVSAWMAAVEAGWKPESFFGVQRLWVGADAASGDQEAGGDVETFHQLFPLGHAYLGYADFVGRQNVLDVSCGATWPITERATLDVDFHEFFLLERDDALYNAGGAPIRSGLDERHVGSELDVLVKVGIDRHTKAYAGYSHVFTGSGLESSGPSRDVDFGYVGVGFTF